MKRNALIVFSFLLLATVFYLIFLYVPTEEVMGIVQRIFYLMVPLGWLTMLAFIVTAVASILYLQKKDQKWDILALSSAEIGVVFTTLAMATGAIWARPTWGVWWDWGTPRLTSTFILWFIYLAYFLVRNLATEEYRGAAFAAVVAIVGLADIPIIILSISLWQGLHPPALIFESGGLDPKMGMTVGISIIAFTVLYITLLILRVSMRHNEAELRKLKELTA
ncbi:MAG: cytochrome c biogenesis protein CcsA [Dehalococcoidales bacterium]|nr:cytochrome c biogenesis protein CcsA [Dehalococcoidales bacterium]